MIKDLKIYFTPKLLAIFFLGISSGIPLALTSSTLFVRMVESGISKTTMGFFIYAGICYSLKFIWSPIFDNYKLPFLHKIFGRRRSWLLVIQTILIFSIMALGTYDPANNLTLSFTLALLVAFVSASQDIVVDAYRIEVLTLEEQGAGAFMANFGYRIGMLVSNAGALFLASAVSWVLVYNICALAIFVGLITSFLIKEPNIEIEQTNEATAFFERIRFSVLAPFLDFMKRPHWLVILMFVMFFKFGDALAGAMTNPFLLELGFSKIEIASIVKTFGLFATMFGSFVGGVLMYRVGMIKGLWIAGIFQMVSNLFFLILCEYGYSVPLLTIVMSLENFAAGLGSVALIAYLGSLCNVAFSATQYALLSSVATLGRTFLSGPSGIIADLFGWRYFFLISTIAALPGLIFLYILANKLVKIDKKFETLETNIVTGV
jgi:PAT family beta-lactamase induction signal transducer AmpG